MLAERIKSERTKKGLSQVELSKIVGVTQQAVGKWEKGKALPDPAIINQLADIFGVTTDYLFGRSPHRTSEMSSNTSSPSTPVKKLPEDAEKSIEEFTRYIYEKHGLKPE